MSEQAISSIGGDDQPPSLRADLQSIADLPKQVRDDFWELLEPNLAAVLDDRVSALVAKFCRSRDIKPELLAPCVKACRFLFLRAAANNIETPQLGTDLSRIEVPTDVIGGVLLPCYEKARPTLRRRILQNALTRHGPVVVGVDWRIDRILASKRGAEIDAPVALVTLRYRSGDKEDDITLQLLPDAFAQLQEAYRALVS